MVNEDTKGNVEALQRELARRAGVIADLQRSLQSLEAAAAAEAAAAQLPDDENSPQSRLVFGGWPVLSDSTS